MKRLLSAIVFLFAFSNAKAQADYIMYAYTGLEEICSIKNGKKECFTDPGNPKYKWYHKAVYKILFPLDSVFLELSPLFIDKGDTVHSASDGGYYYYKGTYTLQGDTYTFNLQPSFCEYCDKKEFFPRKIIAVKTKNGLMINNRFYRSIL